MLHPQLAADQGVKVIGHVAGGINVLDVGLAIRVDDNAVLYLDAAAGNHIGGWLDAHTHDHKVTIKLATCIGDHPLHAVCAFKARHKFTKVHLHTIFTMKIGKDTPNIIAQDMGQWDGQWFDHGYRDTALTEGGCHLRANKAHAHHHRPAAWTTCGANAIRIRNCAQIINAGQIGARHGQLTVAHAGGNEDFRIGNAFAIFQFDYFLYGINAFGQRAKARFNRAFNVVSGWSH